MLLIVFALSELKYTALSLLGQSIVAFPPPKAGLS